MWKGCHFLTCMIRFIMGDIIMTVHSMVQLRGDHLLQAMKRDVNEQAT